MLPMFSQKSLWMDQSLCVRCRLAPSHTFPYVCHAGAWCMGEVTPVLWPLTDQLLSPPQMPRAPFLWAPKTRSSECSHSAGFPVRCCWAFSQNVTGLYRLFQSLVLSADCPLFSNLRDDNVCTKVTTLQNGPLKLIIIILTAYMMGYSMISQCMNTMCIWSNQNH